MDQSYTGRIDLGELTGAGSVALGSRRGRRVTVDGAGGVDGDVDGRDGAHKGLGGR